MENGSRRLQALVFHSPRLPGWNRGKTAIREQLEISWLLWSGRADRQSSLGNGSGHFGFAERILPCFCPRTLLRFLRIGRARKSTGAIRPPANPGQPPTIEYALKKNAPYVPTPLPFEDMLFLISDGGIASCLKTTTGETLWRERWKAITLHHPSS